MHSVEMNEYQPIHAETRRKRKGLIALGLAVVAIFALIMGLSAYSGDSSAYSSDSMAISAAATEELAYGVWGFFPWLEVPYNGGFVVRTYNITDATSDDYVIESGEGELELEQGHTYWVAGLSIVNYFDAGAVGGIDLPTERPAGDASVFYGEQQSKGTFAETIYGNPSMFSSIVTATNAEDVMSVQHNVEPVIDDLWLAIDGTGSHMHLFARMAVYDLQSDAKYALFSYSTDENLLFDDTDGYVPFNEVNAQTSTNVMLSDGFITFLPGTYHFHSSTVMTYKDMEDETNFGYGDASVGYCFLDDANAANEHSSMLSGSLIYAVYSTPCIMESIIVVEETLTLGVKVQLGDENPNVWMGHASDGESNVFSNVAIFEIAEDASYGVYSYLAEEDELANDSWNTRHFNTVNAQQGSDITLLQTGETTDGQYISVQPGTYRLSGFSLMIGMSDNPGVGYCEVMGLPIEDPQFPDQPSEVLVVGNVAQAGYKVPCIFETVWTFEEPQSIYVRHQAGDAEDSLYMGKDVLGSYPDLFARITIQRLSD